MALHARNVGPLIGASWMVLIGALPAQAAELSDELALFPRDAAFVVASPLRLSSYSWMVPIGAGALAATMAFDGTLRDRLVRLREWSGRDGFRESGDLLQFSGLALGAGLMAYGKAKDDDSALDNGWLELEGGATAASIGALLKWTIGRARPGGRDPDHFKPFSSGSSFPSGHTLMAFTAAEIVSQEYPNRPVRVPSFLIAASVGVSRLAADQHWTGDVLGSALLGVAIGHAIVKAHRRPPKGWRLLATGDGAAIELVFQ